MNKKVKISEIFDSVQGEGSLIGTPSVFIRMSGCNLRCFWCDTPYASWYPEGELMFISEIIESVKKFGHRHVVVTGGEPMMFDAVVPLCKGLKELGMHITIETAGTVYQDVECDLMSISPKLANSTPPSDSPDDWAERHEKRRFNPEVLNKLMANYEYQLKYVISEWIVADAEEIKANLKEMAEVEPSKIHLMPEGKRVEVLEQRMKFIVKVCMQEGWRLAPRLQIHLFGDTKGT